MSFVQQRKPRWLTKWPPPISLHPSAVVVTLAYSFFFGFLPIFIYGLLPSNPGTSSNMSFVRQTITKMADKMATAYQFASIRCCGHSYLVIFLRISSNFHKWIASIKPWFKFEHEFCPTNDNLCQFNKMASKMAATYWFALVDTMVNLVIYHVISQVPNFILISFIIHLPNFEYVFFPMNDN